PTAVSRGGRPWFAVGASGANRIMPAVFQIAAFLLDCGLSLEEASHLPRIDAPDANGIHVRDGGHFQGEEDVDALREFADWHLYGVPPSRDFHAVPYADGLFEDCFAWSGP
ncbi:hypothetical protein HN937_20690, partial [Candidatus Poribacteria bacterium]|nr:hypothetical protein [Candidatus Poribacteria bacterium]